MDNKEKCLIKNLYRHPQHSLAYPLLKNFDYPWQALAHITQFILQLGETLSPDEYNKVNENIWIAKSANIAESASISGPCIICANAEVRHCAYVRGSVIIGEGAVVGNSTELKNCILFDGVQVPHYNYVGDSILGYKAHMGAGAITSNVKGDKSLVAVCVEGSHLQTGRKKCGAMLGDFVEIGCNTVLNPGTVVGAGTQIYPLSSVRGYIEENCIFKTQNCIVKRK